MGNRGSGSVELLMLSYRYRGIWSEQRRRGCVLRSTSSHVAVGSRYELELNE